MKITIIIDEEHSGYTPLDACQGGDREKLSAATAIIAGQVLPYLMEMAVDNGQLVRTLRWPMSNGGKVGYVLVDTASPLEGKLE